jgi:WD40 repeat protein
LEGIIDELRRRFSPSENAIASDTSQSNDDRHVTVPALDTTNFATTSFFHAVARIGAQVADALDHAHNIGVVHRDIKPSNLLLDEHATVYVTDFGLAHVAGNQQLTRTGELVGTLRYMSPEQAAGHREGADCRTDIYSLGATLYELITLRPPCGADDRKELLRNILDCEPVPPCRLRPEVPRDLGTIILKALSKDPAERYASARQMAEDLRAFQEHRPISARRPSIPDRVRKWLNRNPWIVGSAAAMVLTALVSLVISNVSIRQAWQNERLASSDAQRARAHADEQRRLAEQRLTLTRRTNFNLQLAQVKDVWRYDPLRASQLLDNPESCPPEFRDFTWHFYKRLCQRDRITLAGHNGAVKDAVYLPKRRLVVSAGVDRTIRVWDADRRAQITAIDAHQDVISALDVSPDESLLASASHDGTVRVWTILNPDGKCEISAKFVLKRHTGPVTDVVISPNGHSLASCGLDAVVRVWDSKSGEEIAQLRRPEDSQNDRVVSLAYSPSGTFLAAASNRQQVWIWRLPDGELIQSRSFVEERARQLSIVVFTPDEKIVAVAHSRGIRFWHWEDDTIQDTLPGHMGSAITGMAFTADGEQLISSGFDGCLRIWGIRSDDPKSSITGHKDRINSLHFSTADGIATTASYDGTVKLWQLDNQLEDRTLRPPGGVITTIAFSPKAQMFLSTGTDGKVCFWDAADGKQVGEFEGHGGRVQDAKFSPDGTLLASAGSDKSIKVWDAQTFRRVATLTGPTERVVVLAFSPDGRLLAAGGLDQKVWLWDVRSKRVIHVLEGHTDRIWALNFSPDGRQLVSSGRDGTIRFWNPTSGRLEHTLRGPAGQAIGCCLFSPDGKTLATATSRISDEGEHDGRIHLWDLSTLQIREALQGHTDEVLSVAFSPNGDTLASCGRDRIIRLWDPDTGQERANLYGHKDWIKCLEFSHDGNYLVSAGEDSEIKIWNAAPLEHNVAPAAQLHDCSADESFRTLTLHTENIRDFDFNSQRDLFASASDDGTIVFWEPNSGIRRRTIKAHAGRVSNVNFSPDGSVVLSAGFDGSVRFWNLQSGEMLDEVTTAFPNAFGRLSPDGKFFVAVSVPNHDLGDVLPPGDLAVYDYGEELPRWRATGEIFRHPLISADATAISSVQLLSGDTLQLVWRSVATGETLATSPPIWGSISSFRFSPDGKLLAIGTDDPDRPVQIWDAIKLDRLRILHGHTDEVDAMAFSPDGRLMASGALDSTIRLWDLSTGTQLKTLRGHIDGVTALIFTADGKTLISGGRDRLIKFWDVSDIH